MPSGGILTIGSENVVADEVYTMLRPGLVAGRYVRVSVSDTGSGMTPDVVERAFDPFFTTKALGKGTGLGLSMVYGFIKQSGGHVMINSEPGRGTTITMLLSAAVEVSVTDDAGKAQAAIAASQNELILIVEDDPDVRDVTAEFLARLGYRVAKAGSADEALTLLDGLPDIALLLTDLILPEGRDGTTLARHARGLRPNLKVLFMSGYTDEIAVHEGRLEPGAALLRKPFTRTGLAEQLRLVLDA